jgi:hypothetical protein
VFRENVMNGTPVEPSVIVDADDPRDLTDARGRSRGPSVIGSENADLVANLRAWRRSRRTRGK